MPGLMILAHAPLASALRDVACHIYPDCAARLLVLDVLPSQSVEQVEGLAREMLRTAELPEMLILTDVFGATPSNAAQRLSEGNASVRVVAGVNVPMLWRTLCYADDSLEACVSRAVAGATQGVMSVAVSRPQNQTSKVASHDQDARHHQQ